MSADDNVLNIPTKHRSSSRTRQRPQLRPNSRASSGGHSSSDGCVIPQAEPCIARKSPTVGDHGHSFPPEPCIPSLSPPHSPLMSSKVTTFFSNPFTQCYTRSPEIVRPWLAAQGAVAVEGPWTASHLVRQPLPNIQEMESLPSPCIAQITPPGAANHPQRKS